MILTKEYNELIDDLIDFRVSKYNDDVSLLKDMMRYGTEGYVHRSSESLIDRKSVV